MIGNVYVNEHGDVMGMWGYGIIPKGDARVFGLKPVTTLGPRGMAFYGFGARQKPARLSNVRG